MAFIILNGSCKRDSIDDSTNTSTVISYSYKNDSYFAPLSTAIEVAENINKSKVTEKSSLISAKYSEKSKIKSNLTILDKDKQNPYFYVVNYESGGFAIISADKRLSPIVGYCDQGCITMDSIPSVMRNWFEMTATYLKQLRITNKKPSILVSRQWANLLNDQNLLKNAPVTPPLPDDYEVDIVVGPLLKTIWSQGIGYNTYCPILSDGPGGHAWTGCATTAIAQVMAYWKYPTTYKWSEMLLKSGNDPVAVLMGDIFPDVISSCTSDRSECTNDFKITHVLLNKFHYGSASLSGYVNGSIQNGGYNYQTVVSNLDAGEPVILGGYDSQVNILNLYTYAPPSAEGHTWVCDGYRKTIFSTETYLLFHMNWGLTRCYEGWYMFNDWTSDNGSYNCCADMIYNIHP